MELRFPLIMVNFKTYLEATGDGGLRLAKTAEMISDEYDVCIAAVPQYVDVRLIASNVRIPVFAQHVDPIEPGPNTGHVLPESIKYAGAVGTLVNHSERRIGAGEVECIIKRCSEVGIVVCVCGDTRDACVTFARFKPDIIAIEPPELIGTGIPVSRAKPEVVLNTVEAVEKVHPQARVLCGAGIVKGEDIEAALKLGTEGVIVASGVVKAKNPGNVLRGFAEAMVRHL